MRGGLGTQWRKVAAAVRRRARTDEYCEKCHAKRPEEDVIDHSEQIRSELTELMEEGVRMTKRMRKKASLRRETRMWRRTTTRRTSSEGHEPSSTGSFIHDDTSIRSSCIVVKHSPPQCTFPHNLARTRNEGLPIERRRAVERKEVSLHSCPG